MSFDFKKILRENIKENNILKEEKMVRESSQKNSIDSLIHYKEQTSIYDNLLQEEVSLLYEELLTQYTTHDFDSLDEGFWSKVKHFGAKVMGTMEKGGKIIG
ncbi:unnamed protein product, partial [marine sediment metagenome]